MPTENGRPPSREVLFAITTPGLEEALASEARALGFAARAVFGGAELEGPSGFHRRANLWLRTANRVLWRIAETDASSPASLEKGLRQISLAPYGGGDQVARIQASHVRSDLEAAARRALRVDVRGAAEESGGLGLWLRVDRGRAQLSVDTSGELLYRRGYRQEVSRAPLRETIAAGMLLLAGFDPHEPFFDPMCGSGTLAIEAALIARRAAPGWSRSFAFERFPCHDRTAFGGEKAQAQAGLRPLSPSQIRGSDLNAGSLGTARRNARRAGLSEGIQWDRLDATTLPPLPGRPGLCAVNLPYGVRVGERVGLSSLYRSFGDALARSVPGWRVAALLADETLIPALGLREARVLPLDNGGIPVRLVLGRAGS